MTTYLRLLLDVRGEAFTGAMYCGRPPFAWQRACARRPSGVARQKHTPSSDASRSVPSVVFGLRWPPASDSVRHSSSLALPGQGLPADPYGARPQSPLLGTGPPRQDQPGP
jgi:hypothetical protein